MSNFNHPKQFDVIVVGGGHAGTEAAVAAAKMGAKTLLLTHNIDTLGQMSCNPAIGGIGKGHLVREIDALGGVMAKAADLSGIQFRTLNASKGPAVRATRAQIDRALYRQTIRKIIDETKNLSLFQQSVDDLIIENDQVTGVVTQMGVRFTAKTVVLTVGTFLDGKIHIGQTNFSGGRAGCPPAKQLAIKLRKYPFTVGRLKTGTPPRLDGRTIDYSKLEIQRGDTPCPVFSFLGSPKQHPEQTSCYITHTNSEAHEIIKAGLSRSPLYSGEIEGVGPRYCPSIEDKVMRFGERNAHQIFVEPEGLGCDEIYPNGISTSLPFDVQLAFVQKINGFEHVHITRPGYAIEYDYFDPRGLKASLETQYIEGLFFAGQINGTTGYEEAAAQGLIAGINACRLVQNKPAWSPSRQESYIGVLIDDLITQGTNEPYRMFTSRAEYRLSLREDNADLRLTEQGRQLGLVDDVRWQQFKNKRDNINAFKTQLQKLWVQAGSMQAVELEKKIPALRREYSAWDLLKRPELEIDGLIEAAVIDNEILAAGEQVIEQLNIQARYDGYLNRQQEEINRVKQQEHTIIPRGFDYVQVKGLSSEVCEKLREVQPETLGQASRIQGVTPAAISMLLVYLKKAG